MGSRTGRDDVSIEVERPTRGRAGHPWSPYLALLQVGFGRRYVSVDDRTLLPSDFTLILPSLEGRCVSVPLSVPRGSIPIARGGHESLGVTQHPARWSPDFPPLRRVGAAVTQPTWLSNRTLAYRYRRVKLTEMGLTQAQNASATAAQYRLAAAADLLLLLRRQ